MLLSNTDGVETHLHIAALAVYLDVLHKILRRPLQLPRLALLLDQMVVADQHLEVQLVMPMDRMVAVAARMGRSKVSCCVIPLVEEDHSDEDVFGDTVFRVTLNVWSRTNASTDVLILLPTS